MIYENVKEYADKKGMTIAALEREAGLANGTIGKWQTVSPRVENLLMVAAVLKVPVSKLLGKKETEVV